MFVPRPWYVASLLAPWLCLAAPLPTLAQITPDATLGAEGSVVTPEMVQGAEAELIEGGAVRDGNLFHSFLEFNIDDGQRVYFANPAGIESILSRVTGGNPSNIFGTLGVDGAADLFMINPNGIVFGENATLDIQGSFYASTAEAIPLGDGIYSATEPEQSSLLTVHPSALFSNYLSDASGDIQNRGQLAAQGNLTLAANNLDLQGQVAAGGDLTLLGLDTVQIRDTADTPFVGFAGGALLVQGNELVDIVALSHGDSGLYSHGDMVLRSGNPVAGDAHYWSGGSFRVETLDHSLGELFSPIDPVIRALGDVELLGYSGGSLHILAGGSVNIGTAIITDADPGELGVDFLRETITLSDGTVVEIDGGAQPTLDVRAGVSPEAIGLVPPGNITGLDPAFILLGLDATTVPTNGDITVGDVLMAAPNGLVLLTTRYQPNARLSRGNILVTGQGLANVGIDARGFGGQGGVVYLDARNNVVVTNSSIQTTGAGVVGDVVINAGNTVRFERQTRRTVAASNLAAGVTGTGGNIRIVATNVELFGGAQLQSSIDGTGNAGNVEIKARDRIVFDGTSADGQLPSAAFSDVGPEAEGAGGNVVIRTGFLALFNGAQLQVITAGIGDAGNVEIEARDSVVFDGTSADGQLSSAAFSDVGAAAEGTGGSVIIRTGSLIVTNGAGLNANTFGTGNAGNVEIEARDSVVFDGTSTDGRFRSATFSRVGPMAEGVGGNVLISTGSLTITNGARLNTSTAGFGDAGNVKIEAHGSVILDGRSDDGQFPSGVVTRVERQGTGQAGGITISANLLQVSSGATLTSSTLGIGDAGHVDIDVRGAAVFDNNSTVFSNVASTASGTGGNLVIRTSSLTVTNGAQLITDTRGIGDAGRVDIDARDTILFDGTSNDGQFPSAAFSTVEFGAVGAGGDVVVTTGSLAVTNGARLSTSTEGTGDAGNVVINVDGRMRVVNGTIDSFALETSGGQIDIQAGNLILRNNSDILTAVAFGEGSGGNITIIADFVIALDDSDILAFSADGRGGNIDLSRTTFFGQNANIGSGSLTREELFDLINNDRVDVNASGAVESGQIIVGDSSFIENSLTSLADTIIDTAALTAGSCIARTDDSLGDFVITGSGGLPQRPGDSGISAYPTGTVRPITEPTATLQEPDGVYQLPDGRLVLSHACE
ncbi:filamentous hemagglutinin N-terminal domain-containing protein [Nodosilinea sp. P-1105]|uniref:two-partner secretion domain-containing protein n=1 Tax=Nodosilinea sp. P-1105 TaxID=2546229 RepID=UPI00146E224A|nr:filamentous hemagglutinin N-terminal domain-containing protein [Nodosilinea sp. P-1105]NMF83364.1 filamentous hemagglutinin N-terminal domain-containing protein [Nodosilinea sp. P-1105]